MASMMILISSCDKKTTPQKIDNKQNKEQNLEKKEPWIGVYEGNLKGYEGSIKVKITLNKNLTYQLLEYYDHKEHANKGKFQWNNNNNSIKLEDGRNFKIVKEGLKMLNENGDEVKIDNASTVLKKIDD